MNVISAKDAKKVANFSNRFTKIQNNLMDSIIKVSENGGLDIKVYEYPAKKNKDISSLIQVNDRMEVLDFLQGLGYDSQYILGDGEDFLYVSWKEA